MKLTQSLFFLSHNILLYEDGHAVVADFGGKTPRNIPTSEAAFSSFIPVA